MKLLFGVAIAAIALVFITKAVLACEGHNGPSKAVTCTSTTSLTGTTRTICR